MMIIYDDHIWWSYAGPIYWDPKRHGVGPKRHCVFSISRFLGDFLTTFSIFTVYWKYFLTNPEASTIIVRAIKIFLERILSRKFLFFFWGLFLTRKGLRRASDYRFCHPRSPNSEKCQIFLGSLCAFLKKNVIF